MIDLHFHCLPGIDDGPESWDEAVELCRAAAADGTTTIVATPHVLRDGWLNESPRERDELILKLNTLLGGTPAILPGCEFFYSYDAPELWELGADGPLTGLNRSNYLLIEFPGTLVPRDADSVIHELVVLGVTPVIAHPERNLEFSREPDLLERFVEKGAIVQVTASSLTGEFGRPPFAAAQELLRRGLVHLVASDAHNLVRRPPRLAAARERVRRDWGEELEVAVFEDNARAVIEGRELNWRRA
jgi:protein-tyrosine phosphatase